VSLNHQPNRRASFTLVRYIQWAKSVGIHSKLGVGITVAFVVLSSSLANAGSAASKVPFAPAIVARAGTTNVLYVLSESSTCSVRECLRLERSNNGGRTFIAESVPPVTKVLGGTTAPIDNLYFANPNDGYAEEFTSTGAKWETTSLFLTHDGGRTWSTESIAPHDSVYGFASSSRYFYAVTEECTVGRKGRCSHIQLNRSAVGTSTWEKLQIPRQILKYWGGIQVAAFGSRVWLSTQDQDSAPFSPYLATSRNSGDSFTVAAQPQLSSAGSCGLLPVSEEVLWAECDQGMMQGDILYSRDGGSRWQFNQNSQLGRFAFGVFEPVGTVAYFINEMAPRTFFLATNEASTPRAIGVMPGDFTWMTIDMTNGKQGLALSQGAGGSSLDILWRTTDGGEHWTRVAFKS
jgi:hypothetical protein